MSEMVERVAREIAPLAWAALGMADTREHARRREKSLQEARAAIAAMREPDKAMIQKGDDTLDDCMDSSFDSDSDGNRYPYNYLMSGSATRTWRAMIDEALR